ncbi:hypothetical protein O4J56_06090 [Nocardiopsis sp. RSe5-2]|uniref:VWA domain-containing protein n=1 Tax=Nocardiopsis endophytica TaxID=3018445 RepID=A0ABT4TZT4_9ACTN|nr:hypothetical protein [Nocardiopsis endophytica]MDA2810203.1 hypothetical protein [Nocardiopsis endophytica]
MRDTHGGDTYTDLLACEDVLRFANAAISGTGQREFRSGAAEQRLTLDFLHDYVRINYRDLYAASLALDVNDHNAARIVHGLLSDPGEPGAAALDRRTEGALVSQRLAHMPPQRVYRLFRRLAAERVNNRRTRAVIARWISRRRDLAFDAVKYRAGLTAAARHAHLRQPGEISEFCFTPPHRAGFFATPLLETYRAAHYSMEAAYELPLSVGEGFAAKHGVPRKEFLSRARASATGGELLRLDRSLRGHGLEGADLRRAGLTRLCSYVLALPVAEREERREELTSALRAAARRIAGGQAGTWGPTAAVLDDSYSSFGSPVKRNRPLAVALACHFVLAELSVRYTAHWVSGHRDALTVRPEGATPLAETILDALEDGPERLVVVSDGYDDGPPVPAALLDAWRTRVDPGHRTAAVHLNPVMDADEMEPARLARSVPTVGIRDASALPSLVELARFGEGRSGLSELREHLERRVAAYIADVDEKPTVQEVR